MQKLFGIPIGKNIDCHFELASHLAVQQLHDLQGNRFMMYIFDQFVFECMREWAMPRIVEEDCQLCSQFFCFADFNTLSFETVQCITHQVISAQCMMQTGMNGSRINEVGKSHLLNAPQALKNRMADQCAFQFSRAWWFGCWSNYGSPDHP